MSASITISGNMTRNPELRYSDTGTALVRFGVAVSYKTKTKPETTSFYDVVAFNSLAENVAASLASGNRVNVTGRVEVRKYQKKDGTEGTAVEIVADEIGPSLRWATATIEKNSKDSGYGGGSGGSENWDAF